jgi:hypothetical protein
MFGDLSLTLLLKGVWQFQMEDLTFVTSSLCMEFTVLRCFHVDHLVGFSQLSIGLGRTGNIVIS